MFESLRLADCHRCLLLHDEPSGLRAIIVIDSVELGPAVGGVRTMAYPSDLEALADATRLARAMTLKCSIANLPAGGAKTVVLDHPGLDRPKAFRRLGRYIQELGGIYWSAGDLGTCDEDILAMAETTRYVNSRAAMLSEAAGQGVVNCIRACASLNGLDRIDGLRIAIQGCGSMGSGVARELARTGAQLVVADVDQNRAAQLAEQIGGRTIDPAEVLQADVDIVAPCAAGGVIDSATAANIRAWAVCGAANNQLASAEAGRILADREILFVPDFLSSAGAVTAGVVTDIMGQSDPTPYIDALGRTARQVLETSLSSGKTSTEVAEQMARERIAGANRR